MNPEVWALDAQFVFIVRPSCLAANLLNVTGRRQIYRLVAAKLLAAENLEGREREI